MKEPFYFHGLNFSCARCSRCCRGEPGVVYLSLNDLNNLCAFFSMPATQFVSVFCRWIFSDRDEVLALKEKSNFDCILWNDGCSAYDFRPVQCSTFPFWSWILKDKKTWNEMSKECCGINCGENHSFEQIMAQKSKYDSIKPLCKHDFLNIFAKNECEFNGGSV